MTTAGGDPTVADSPTPFAPIGWWGDGVTVNPVSQSGTSSALGMQIVHQRCPEAVAAVVEGDHFHERDADAVGEPAMHLPLDDHRVDADAAVVYGDEPAHGDDGGSGVDIDNTDVRAVWAGEVLRVVADLCLEAALDAIGQVAGAVRAHRDVLDGD